ncbi:uncharacterized protein LOC123313723 isoform X1 [Coccinella septempunctata]|uniref:uncharacterized protein LOC123313723 isoform X1 n=1 Tax=Coccinella septempunctata TaxID=41139 RepID=UPI001D06976D|nr:uncharacterized protein LOC123313723 isoform X1 [Coccinella septempunctata]
MFHLCTGIVGIVDRDSGSDLAGVVITGRSGLIQGAGKFGKDTLRVELIHLPCVGPSGVDVPQSCDCVSGIAGNCRSVPVHETLTTTGGSTPSPKSISDVSTLDILSGWIGDIPGELGTSTSKRDF